MSCHGRDLAPSRPSLGLSFPICQMRSLDQTTVSCWCALTTRHSETRQGGARLGGRLPSLEEVAVAGGVTSERSGMRANRHNYPPAPTHGEPGRAERVCGGQDKGREGSGPERPTEPGGRGPQRGGDLQRDPRLGPSQPSAQPGRELGARTHIHYSV